MSARERMIRVYDRTMRGSHARRYYQDSGYYNFGYWGGGATSQREASEALVDQLAARIVNKSGRVLDVACGLGACTKRLARIYPSDMITGINISEAQIADARARAPDCTLRVMDATKLDFSDNYFDAIICVEAAFHFDTRDKFFAEAYRVLKPGGSLVLSDILFRNISNALLEFGQIPRTNLVASIADYRARLTTVGFVAIDIQDATDLCLGGFRNNLVHWPASERRAGRLSVKRRIGAALFCRLLAAYFGLVCKTYVLVSARRPK
jgi:MPBQ/MSBQ methyltransferase